MLNDVIEKYIKTFYVKKDENGEFTVYLYLPYFPFKPLDASYAVLDSYYIASNELYKISKKICAELSGYGAKMAKGYLKTMFEDAGIGFSLKNNLLYIPGCGTRAALSVIECGGDFQEVLPLYKKPVMLCDTCGVCQKACPTEALSDGFLRERCLRQSMNEYRTTEAPLSLLRGGLLGCEACQRVCPYNGDLTNADVPEDLKEFIKIENLVKSIDTGRNGLSKLCSYIGENYNKPARMTFFALNAITRKEEAVFALPYIASIDEAVAKKAQEICRRFGLIDEMIQKTT